MTLKDLDYLTKLRLSESTSELSILHMLSTESDVRILTNLAVNTNIDLYIINVLLQKNNQGVKYALTHNSVFIQHASKLYMHFTHLPMTAFDHWFNKIKVEDLLEPEYVEPFKAMQYTFTGTFGELLTLLKTTIK